jgi:hypothetical protein
VIFKATRRVVVEQETTFAVPIPDWIRNPEDVDHYVRLFFEHSKAPIWKETGNRAISKIDLERVEGEELPQPESPPPPRRLGNLFG